MRVGVVGAGRVGLTLAKVMLEAGVEVRAHDVRADALRRAEALGVVPHTGLRELALASDHVIVSTPPRETLRVLDALRGLAREGILKGKVVYDTLTFKEDVIPAYRRFPPDLRVSSIHPLFGPGMRDPSKHVVAVTPVPGREGDSEQVTELFRNLGFRVVVVDPATHDEVISAYLGISYAVAVAVAGTLLKAREGSKELLRGPHVALRGTTFTFLLNHCLSVMSDDPAFIEYVLSRERVRGWVAALSNVLEGLLREPSKASVIAEVFKEVVGEGELRRAYGSMYSFLEGVSRP